ncbi:MAG: hypothetical protein WDN69_37305 [Aliidongia sp.]
MPPPAQGTPRQVLIGTLIAALALSLFASRGLQSWADAKGDSALATMIGDSGRAMSDGIDRLGLTGPHDALRRAIRRIESAHWD